LSAKCAKKIRKGRKVGFRGQRLQELVKNCKIAACRLTRVIARLMLAVAGCESIQPTGGLEETATERKLKRPIECRSTVCHQVFRIRELNPYEF
jgi:hypothetical protein